MKSNSSPRSIAARLPACAGEASCRGRAFLLALLVTALAGCESYSPSEYVAPRVTGRVLDQQSREPVARVKIRRVTADTETSPTTLPHGAQSMDQGPAARTAADGTFVVPSKRDVALVHKMGWYAITLSFERSGYLTLTTNYTLGQSTNTAKGEPVIHAGDICLQPSAK